MADETSSAVCVLFVRDAGSDLEPILRELRAGGFSPRWERADSEEQLVPLLERGGWDLVSVDLSLPALDPVRVSEILRERGIETPVVVIADRMPEELCVGAFRSGAADWVTHGNLSRLGRVVARELSGARASPEPGAVAHRVLVAQEAERRRIAAVLHDDFGQILVTLRLILQSQASAGGLADAVALVDQAIQQTRDLSVELWPAVLDQLGLAAALRWLAERSAPQVEVAVAVDPIGRLPFAVEAAGFRVAQEALANVVRHSRARRVELKLFQRNDAIELVIRDDGTGFDLDEAWRHATDGRSLGLVAMRERAKLAGGWLEVESTPGRGTLVRVRLPLGSAP